MNNSRRKFFRMLLGASAVLPMLPVPALAQRFERRAPLDLQDSPVAGFQYYEGRRLWLQLAEGQAVRLIREPENRHDKNAVAVFWKDQQLGYLPRTQNYAVSQLMDRGQTVTARIKQLTESDDNWQRISVGVVLDG